MIAISLLLIIETLLGIKNRISLESAISAWLVSSK